MLSKKGYSNAQFINDVNAAYLIVVILILKLVHMHGKLNSTVKPPSCQVKGYIPVSFIY